MEPDIIFYIKGFPVTEPVFWTWIIMAILALASFLLTRNLKETPRGAQHLVEMTVEGISNLVSHDLGPEGAVYVPLILMVASFILISNIIGVVPGAFSPTADLNTTVVLATLVFLAGHVGAIHKKGFFTWLKEFFEPYWFLFPINLVGEISQILSHSFRLYGNIFGGGILLGIVSMLLPYVAPVPLLAWFGVFMGAIQTAVFTMLAVAYIQMKIN